MNRNQFYKWIIAGLLLLNIFLLAGRFFHKGPRGQHAEGPKKMIIHRLGFDKSQADTFKVLAEEHQKMIHSMDKKMATLKSTLYAELNASNGIAVQDSLLKELGMLNQKIERIHFDHFKDIQNLCKPEQMKNFESLSNELTQIFFSNKRRKRKK